MRKITRIFIHCTAGNRKQKPADLLAWFKKLGWKAPGYHFVVTEDGEVHKLHPIEEVANGVQGYNQNSIHVAWTGGIDAKGKGTDNRTEAQKRSLKEIVGYLKGIFPSAMVLGHRDISPDKNGNGVVDPWERIKECPCFEVREEFGDL